MSNNQFYSCERNHYFFGKLMTVRDFENEQVYLNSKRRLGNRMLNGVGIVSGLDIIMVDSRTISLESGIAIDYEGREIVVSEPSVRRLNVIKGFEENKENGDMYLCLEYKESLKESTFSVVGSGKDSDVSQEYNRISEGYDLFLTSKKPDISSLNLDSLVFTSVPVYDKNGIKIEVQIARYANPNSLVKVSVLFEKNNVSAPIKYEFNIGGELFKAVNGKSLTNISYQETEVSTYKRVKKDYYIECDAVADAVTELCINKDSFSITIGQNNDTIEDDIKQSVIITSSQLRDVIIEDYYARHFDEMMEVKDDQNIYLAKFHIVSNQSTYMIEDFEKHPFKQYLLSNNLLSTLQTALNNVYLPPEVHAIPEKVEKEEAPRVPAEIVNVNPENIVTGVERINLGLNPKVGRPYYSYEFIHGLGYGKVGVVVAIENKANYMNNDDNILVFGNADIFNSEEFSMSAPIAQVGAVVNPDKGTMRLGAKLLEKTSEQSIDVRWWAFKSSKNDEPEKEIVIDDNVKVVITPNTTRIEPLGQVRFSAHIEGSSSQEVRWMVTESGAGKIDENGLYTAPSKEGVYEIKAQSVKFESKTDSAYVVVSAGE